MKIKRVRGEGAAVRKGKQINGLLGLLKSKVMGGGGLRLGPLGFFFFIPNLNRFGSVRVGRFRHTKTGNRTEPDIFLNILTSSIGFFYRFGFFG
jgi:hypothetical protein